MCKPIGFLVLLLAVSGCGPADQSSGVSTGVQHQLSAADISEQVRETERAFAASMADRDFEAFREFLSDEAVFISGDAVLRGKEAVENGWRGYFDGLEAPFSWEPDVVEPLSSGQLALSTGPVYVGDSCAATFTSIWRRVHPADSARAGDGTWKIIFDRGTSGCEKR